MILALCAFPDAWQPLRANIMLNITTNLICSLFINIPVYKTIEIVNICLIFFLHLVKGWY